MKMEQVARRKRKERWQVWKAPDNVLFESNNMAACLRYVRACRLMSSYRAGRIRIGKLIWEAPHHGRAE